MWGLGARGTAWSELSILDFLSHHALPNIDKGSFHSYCLTTAGCCATSSRRPRENAWHIFSNARTTQHRLLVERPFSLSWLSLHQNRFLKAYHHPLSGPRDAEAAEVGIPDVYIACFEHAGNCVADAVGYPHPDAVM